MLELYVVPAGGSQAVAREAPRELRVSARYHVQTKAHVCGSPSPSLQPGFQLKICGWA